MPQISIDNLSLRFRGPSLLDDVSVRIESGQRIGLVGRNGAGKTTLMRLIHGEVEPDHGQILFEPRTTTSLLPQEVPTDLSGSIREVVATGRDNRRREGGRRPFTVDEILSRMKLDSTPEFHTLSSGMKRRVLLAKALASDPDVLLLDEPTNHLDLEAIDRLEAFLSKWRGTLIFVTHDRMFLRRLATRILEIDRGRCFDWACDYDTFLKRKHQALAAEEKQNALFDKKLAQEEAWIRQGIKARRTRNEGRVRALKKLRDDHRLRRNQEGNVRLRIQEAQRSGNLVAEAKDIAFSYAVVPIIQGFSTTILRGDKIGIVGPNGVGKTTLLNILLGKVRPTSGRVRTGTNLEVAYFDQLRMQLDEDRTVQDNVGDGYDLVKIGGQPQHVVGYLKNFLFSPERIRTKVKFLSGGERNRILLAKLFAKPANTIVLDEPTNDLDTETLELLEARLVEFNGTVLVVSHDREFLNNVVTSTIAFEPSGVHEYVGGYDDWLRQRPPSSNGEAESGNAQSRPAERHRERRSPANHGKLSYNLQRELDALPAKIEAIEQEMAGLHAEMTQPEYYRQEGDQQAQARQRLSELQQALDHAYQRWQELE